LPLWPISRTPDTGAMLRELNCRRRSRSHLPPVFSIVQSVRPGPSDGTGLPVSSPFIARTGRTILVRPSWTSDGTIYNLRRPSNLWTGTDGGRLPRHRKNSDIFGTQRDLRYLNNEVTISRGSLIGAALLFFARGRGMIVAVLVVVLVVVGIYVFSGVIFRKIFIRLVISRDILHNNTTAVRPTAWTGRTPSSPHHGLDGLPQYRPPHITDWTDYPGAVRPELGRDYQYPVRTMENTAYHHWYCYKHNYGCTEYTRIERPYLPQPVLPLLREVSAVYFQSRQGKWCHPHSTRPSFAEEVCRHCIYHGPQETVGGYQKGAGTCVRY